MLDFEEELKKFHPSPEVDELEDTVYSHDVTDVTDLLVEVEKGRKGRKPVQE